MATKKDLQKFTETEKKIDALFELEKITLAETEALTKEERDLFFDKVNDRLQSYKDLKRDKFLKQIEPITVPEMKNKLWEYNNNQIMNAIINYIEECGCMPHQSQIAEKTGLSRQTIHKHIKELKTNELYKSHIEQFQFMMPKMLGTLMRLGIKGDVKAIRLLLEYTADNPAKKIGTQNNYIQINGMIFTEEKLKTLPPEQLKAIETILTTSETVIECEAVYTKKLD